MLAAIDVGSNTVRMLLATIEGGRLQPERYFRRITRLCGGSTAAGLAPESVARTMHAIDEIATLFADYRPRRVRIVGTEALRSAANGGEVAAEIARRCGYPLEILSGAEEASLSAAGVLAGTTPPPVHCVIFDIGGGSTEFIVRSEGNNRYFRSYPLGVVRLSEAGNRSEALQQRLLEDFSHDLTRGGWFELAAAPECELVGTAGTVTTLAAMLLQMREYDWRRVNNYRMNRAELALLLERIAVMTPRQREELPGVEEGRGDLILPGLQLVLGIMHALRKETLRVSDFGLLEGTILSLATVP